MTKAQLTEGLGGNTPLADVVKLLEAKGLLVRDKDDKQRKQVRRGGVGYYALKRAAPGVDGFGPAVDGEEKAPSVLDLASAIIGTPEFARLAEGDARFAAFAEAVRAAAF